MYEELVERLRSHNGWALNETLDEAADAIEGLQTVAKLLESDRDAERILRLAAEDKQWIPVTEGSPKKRDRYLTVSIEPWYGTTVVDIVRWSGGKWQTEATVTHWQPLPEPPKEEN